MLQLLRRLERATRPVDPEVRAVLARRWAQLPEVARTPAQVLGRHAVGCEGTHGVFPRCNLACTPCYHSRDANRVRVDGAHTLAEVERQMAFLRQQRGRARTRSSSAGRSACWTPTTMPPRYRSCAATGVSR
jgi:hypothetical protein